VTKTGCFILSALWTKQGPLERLTNGQPTSSQVRWAGHHERENVYLRPQQQSRVVLAPAVRKRTRFRQNSKGPNDIQAQSRSPETRSLVVTHEVGRVYLVFSMENREGNSELRTTTRWCSFESV
jgi:hypothetical protein